MFRAGTKLTRSVRDTQVQHLALPHDIVQAVHDLLNRRGVVPPVHVEDIDVVGTKLLERGVELRISQIPPHAMRIV
jgi:hypothetical protein